MIKKLKGVILTVYILSFLTGCSANPKTEDVRYRVDNVKIFQNTPAWELAQAVNKQNTKRIEQIVEKTPEILNYKDPMYDITLLFWAIGTEKMNSAEALLRLGANPNIISSHFDFSILYLAAGYSWIDTQVIKDPKFVKLLLDYDADPDLGYVGNDSSNISASVPTPLMRSIGCGIEKTKALVEAGADINYRTDEGLTVAIHALMHGGPNRTLEMLKYSHYIIVEKKAEIIKPWLGKESDEELAPVNLLRNWIYPLDSDRYIIKMEIVDEFVQQGEDYWSTEITEHQFNQIRKLYPDSWEDYITRY